VSLLLAKHGWPYRKPPTGVPFTVNRDSEQAEGLVGWWPTLGSRGQNVLRDYSGRARNGIFGGTPIHITNAELGVGIQFEDVGGDYINVGAISEPSNAITLVSWVRTGSGSQDDFGVYVGKQVAGGPPYLSYGLRESTSVGGAQSGFFVTISNVFRDAGQYVLSANTVYCLVGTWRSGDNLRYYVNGVQQLVTAAAYSGTITYNNIYPTLIGRSNLDNASVNATIFDTRIYNRALTVEQARQLYDPQTRWELYRPLIPRRRYYVAAAAPAATVGHLALLGVG